MADQKQTVSYSWSPITDLPDDWERLRNLELHSLAQVWAEQRIHLQETHSIKKFNEQLLREWSIETGILERSISLTNLASKKHKLFFHFIIWGK